MTADFLLQTDFVAAMSNLKLPEDVTEANVAIHANHDCLTLNRQAGRSRLLATSETVFGPVAGLADWFIENWGAIIWEIQTPFAKSRDVDISVESPPFKVLNQADDNWSDFLDPALGRYAEELETLYEAQLEERADWEHRHLMGHGCSDLAIPRILIIPEDRSVVLIVDGLPKDSGASITFLSPEKTPRRSTILVVSKESFKAEAAQFVRKTIEQGKSTPKFSRWANWLSDRWDAAQKEEKDSGRRLQWMIGDLAARRVSDLQRSHPDIAIPLESILRDCPIVTDKRKLGPIETVIEDYMTKTTSAASPSRVSGWRGFGKGSSNVTQPDYQQGYELARLARSRMALGDRPLRDPGEILDRFGVKLEPECDSPLFRVAICASKQAGAHIVPSSVDTRMKSIPGFRFGVFSGLGRLLWQGRGTQNKPICAAQGDHAMISQSRRANAFAAEFLLPGETIRGLSPDSLEFLDRVEGYGVSRSAARWHLQNVNANAHG
jgi:hypothetical protein